MKVAVVITLAFAAVSLAGGTVAHEPSANYRTGEGQSAGGPASMPPWNEQPIKVKGGHVLGKPPNSFSRRVTRRRHSTPAPWAITRA